MHLQQGEASWTIVPSSTVYPQSSLPPVSEPRCRWCGEWRHPRPRGRGGQGAQHPAAARRVRAAVGAADGALLARLRPHHLGQRGVRHRPPRVRAADLPSDSSQLHIQTKKQLCLIFTQGALYLFSALRQQISHLRTRV